MIRSVQGRRRKRRSSLSAELRQSARAIRDQGMADAMKAAALMIVARKLDEIRSILAASGLNAAVATPTAILGVASQAASQPSPSVQQLQPVVKNPCVNCGREAVYKSRPNQWNRTGSWYCRTHQSIAGQIEIEDRIDRTVNPAAATQSAPALQPAPAAPAAGASTLAEAMGMAEIVEDQP